MEALQRAEDRAPPSAEALEIAQRRISELELENQILREELKKYELHLGTKENQTKASATSILDSSLDIGSTKENLIKSARITELHELKKKLAMQTKESSSKVQALLESCKKKLGEAVVNEAEVDNISNVDAASSTSPLTTQESDVTPDDASEA